MISFESDIIEETSLLDLMKRLEYKLERSKRVTYTSHIADSDRELSSYYVKVNGTHTVKIEYFFINEFDHSRIS